MLKASSKFRPEKVMKYFYFFYKYLGKSIYIALAGSMMMAILDGIGLTMFIPLLSLSDAESGAVAGESSMGDMSFLVDWLGRVGISLTIYNVLILMVVFFTLKGLARFAADFYRVLLQQRFVNALRLQNMELLAKYDYLAFSKSESGRIQNTFSSEVERINNAYRSYFVMLQQGIMTLVYVGLAYISNPRFALIVAAGGLLSNLAFSRIYKTTKSASRNITSKMHEFQGYLIQSVLSYKFLKATNLMQSYKKKIDESVMKVEHEQRRIGTMNAISVAMREPLIVLIVVIAIIVQITVFEQSIGLILLSLLFFYRGLTSLVAMQNSYNAFLGTSGSVDNMVLFAQDLASHQETDGEIVIDGLEQGINCSDLTYSYDGRVILNHVSVKFVKNQTVGIVGASGTGKTTLVNLVCGLLKAQPGMITVDGVDLNEIEISSYRNRIGYVTQEPQIFSDSIFNNVSFWQDRTPENEERVWRALMLAHARYFVEELPESIDTLIGINGVNLSGGQRQRISIARELFRDIDILVLDEATSALDSGSELMIQENIESLSGQYTIIVIAHRLSTIQKADKVIYLKEDHSYEVGTFESLVSTSRAFRSMVSLQSVG